MSLCSVWCCVAVGIVWVQFSVVWGGARGEEAGRSRAEGREYSPVGG